MVAINQTPSSSNHTLYSRAANLSWRQFVCGYRSRIAFIFLLVLYFFHRQPPASIIPPKASQKIVTSPKAKKRRIGQSFSMDKSPAGSSSIYYRPIESGGLSDGTKFRRYAALNRDSNEPVMVSDWIAFMLSSNSDQQQPDSLVSTIAKCPYKAVYFETKPVTKQSVESTPFEFVLVDADYLYQFAESSPDESAFAEYFQSCSVGSCVFANLGKNAILVAPKPGKSAKKSYSHLAAFVREAPPTEVSSTMSLVAHTYQEVLSNRDENIPLWLSTSGTGVAWLHFRLDDRPKYYQYSKFKAFP